MAPEGPRVTEAERDLLALVDILRDHIARLEREVAALTEAKPRPTCDQLYPKGPNEV